MKKKKKEEKNKKKIINNKIENNNIEIYKVPNNFKKEIRLDNYYVIIKVFYKKKEIGIRLFKKNHKPLFDIIGKNGYKVLLLFLDKLKEKNIRLKKEHIAYIGFEIHKATFALKNNLVYIQDDELNIKEKNKILIESDNKLFFKKKKNNKEKNKE